ncbi:LLM class flavin-dependent oxidoreductase [Pseudonocardia xinjiangensis]|uniref:LLM class flavin-dependent oxidoreductase n=1 Tax=Pseudonocardia xinjiangensis TaxID=75289 RepID=UPI003D8D68E0
MTATVNVGVRIPSADAPDPAELRAFVQRAEALGFESIWVGDHVFHHTDVLQPLDLLSWVAGQTHRVRLGTAVVLAAYLHPVHLAKSAATVDRLSGGRLVLGVALGGTPDEFASLGVPIQQRLGRLLENVTIARRLWREDGVDHAGRYHHLTGASVRPKPLQDPLPVYFGARSEAMLNRLALVADGWVASGHFTTAEFLAAIRTIRERAEASGRDPDRLGITKVQGVSVHRDGRVALDRARRHWQRYYGPAFDVERSVIHGTPEQCAERLAAFTAADGRELTLILEPTSLDVEELDLLHEATRELC